MVTIKDGVDINIDGLNADLSFPTIPGQPVAPEGTDPKTDFIVDNIIKNTIEQKDFTIATGKKITIQSLSGILPSNASGNQDIFVKYQHIDTDTTTELALIEVGRGIYSEPIEQEFEGDGTFLRIEIHNDTALDLYMSARWVGFESDA